MAATILGAVRELIALALPAELRGRIDEGGAPHDLKGEALPRLAVIDGGCQHGYTTESQSEARTVVVEALAKTRDDAEALLARAALPLDSAPQGQGLDVAGADVTYCLRWTGQVSRDPRYDVSQGDSRQRARAAWRIRVTRARP